MAIRGLKFAVLALGLAGCSTQRGPFHDRETAQDAAATWNQNQTSIAKCMRRQGWSYMPKEFRNKPKNSGDAYGYSAGLVPETSFRNASEPPKPADYMAKEEQCSNEAWRSKAGEADSQRMVAVARSVALDPRSKNLDLKWRLCMKEKGYSVTKPGRVVTEVLDPFSLNHSIEETLEVERDVYSQDMTCLARDTQQRKALWSSYWDSFGRNAKKR
jgi:hypothetical protein